LQPLYSETVKLLASFRRTENEDGKQESEGDLLRETQLRL